MLEQQKAAVALFGSWTVLYKDIKKYKYKKTLYWHGFVFCTLAVY